MPKVYRPVESLTAHSLYAPIRACTACALVQTCAGPVPGVGPEHARVMFVLEAPGENEDRWGIPVTGATWEEMEGYLRLAGLDRGSVYLTNAVKCRPKSDPSLRDTYPCADIWLPQEVAMVRPYLLVAVGQLAARRLLNRPTLTLEECHGYTEWSDWWGCWVMPVYHPAAGFYNTKTMRYLQDDFRAIGRAKVGDFMERPVDQWNGGERYVEVTVTSSFWADAATSTLLSVDTETAPDGSLWCLSLSFREGEAWVVMRPLLSALEHSGLLNDAHRALIFHNSFYDVPKLRAAGLTVNPARIYDTMVMARELQLESAGLKELASRWLGMKMESYRDVVGTAQFPLSLSYLERAYAVASRPDYLAPAPEWELVWDKKRTELRSRQRKPQPLHKKLARLLGDLVGGKETDPLERWRNYSQEEVEQVVEEMGQHPIAYLEHVEQERAVAYSARDADATRRLFGVLVEEARRLKLEEVVEMDSRSLPMILAMQDNGLGLDTNYLQELSKEYLWKQASLEAELWDAVGHSWNPGSSDQTALVLFGELKLKPGRRTPTGKLSTDDEVLKPLVGHPRWGEVVRKTLAWREFEKLRGTYIEPWLGQADAGGRIHTDYSGMTETGRLAAKDPNVMAVPKRSEEGRRLRMGIVAGDGEGGP